MIGEGEGKKIPNLANGEGEKGKEMRRRNTIWDRSSEEIG